jgi:hypothetical protein
VNIAEATLPVTPPGDHGVIDRGERAKAVELLRQWVEESATEVIKICDPYFGPDDLDFVRLIRSIHPDIRIVILTSRKQQRELFVPEPLDESYRKHWRLHVSESDPGVVDIRIVGTRSTGEPPVHDRYWLSKDSGLRIGTSLNSVGGFKLSEISPVVEPNLSALIASLEPFFSGAARFHKDDRLDYVTFSL